MATESSSLGGGAARRLGAALGLVALTASAVVGVDAFGLRERLFGTATAPPRAPANSRAGGSFGGEETVLRSQPWWQDIARFEGEGSTTTDTFTIGDGALQWRIDWTCRSGTLVVQAPEAADPAVDATCPGKGTGFAVGTGEMTLDVEASGPWTLEVDQQVDVPLEEPPMPAMLAPGADEIAIGSLYGIDRKGIGDITIYRLANGRHALRLDDFFVTPNIDLEITFSPLQHPRSTEQFADAGWRRVAWLDVTTGSLNFMIPRPLDPSRFRSIVIWCERLHTAYAGASLRPTR